MVKQHAKAMIWKTVISSGRKMHRIPFLKSLKVRTCSNKFLTTDIDAELSRYKQDAARVTQQTGVSSVEEVGNLFILLLSVSD
jgi:hypothetical protein